MKQRRHNTTLHRVQKLKFLSYTQWLFRNMDFTFFSLSFYRIHYSILFLRAGLLISFAYISKKNRQKHYTDTHIFPNFSFGVVLHLLLNFVDFEFGCFKCFHGRLRPFFFMLLVWLGFLLFIHLTQFLLYFCHFQCKRIMHISRICENIVDATKTMAANEEPKKETICTAVNMNVVE